MARYLILRFAIGSVFAVTGKVSGVPNEQLNGVEQLHGTHLHITILEPKILP